MDHSLPGSSVHGIFQARTLEWIAISFSSGSSWPRDQIWVSLSAGRRFTFWAIDYSKYELFNSINLRMHVDDSISHLKMGR